VDYLRTAELNGERPSGWRAAAVRSIDARPVNHNRPLVILDLPIDANQTDLLRKVCDNFKASHFFGGSGGEMRFHDPLACGVGSY
jgi:hypothetical protein